MTYKQRVVRGFAINLIMAFAIAGLGYITRIVLAKNMSVSEYGLFFAVFSFVGFFNLFRDLGMLSTSVKFISQYKAKNNWTKIKTVIVSAYSLQFLIVGIISLFLIFFADFLSKNFFKANAFYVIFFMALSYLLSINQDITTAIAQGFQNMFLANISEVLRHTIIIVILFIGFSFNKTAAVPAFAYFIVMICLFFLHAFILKKLFPNFFRVKSKNKSKMTKNMLKFAFPILISSTGGIIIMYSDTMMITYLKSLEDVAMYNVAIPISMILCYFGTSLSAIMLPVMSEMWNKGHKEQLKEGIALLHKYSFAAIIPFALLFICFPQAIIRILFGEKYLGATVALQILSVGAVLYNVAMVNSNLLVGLGRPKINSKIMLFGAAFNVVLNLFLIPYFGIVGAAISTAASYFLIFVLNTIDLKKVTKAKLYFSNYVKIFFGGVLFLAAIFFLKKMMNVNSVFEIGLASAVSFLVYAAYLIVFKIIDFQEIKGLISTLKNK